MVKTNIKIRKKKTYDVSGDVNEYNMLRQRKKTIENRMKELSERIKSFAFDNGTEDSKGNKYITNDDNYLYGIMSKKKVTLNVDKAKNFLLSNGLYEQCVVTKEEIDEDKLTELVQNEKITLEQLENIMDIKVSYSLDVKEKEKEEEKMPEIKPTKLRK